MSRHSWRDGCRPIIAKVIAAVGTEDRKALRAALREAYPYGQRRYWPYKIWCDEIRRQLGDKRPLGEREPIKPIPGQKELF